MRDDKQRTNEQQLKIELLSQWKLEAESRKNVNKYMVVFFGTFMELSRTKRRINKM